ncbi:MAG: GAF and ANTAR domain-containing protein [Actinobacteria bacterium]|nr:GAF and ANTAR domain-containing protein [Actinomycetota bacterium]
MADTEDLTLDLRGLHDLLLSEATLDTSLQRVAAMAVATIPACDTCGVTLTENRRTPARAATDDLADRVDDIQYGIGRGPCIDAVKTGQFLRIDDMASETRWPEFTKRAAEEGVSASYSAPLKVGSRILGALNLYSRDGRFAEPDQQVAASFSHQAAITLANASAYERTRLLVDQLNEALESRDIIGQAKGIIMVREGIDADAAFNLLRRQTLFVALPEESRP